MVAPAPPPSVLFAHSSFIIILFFPLRNAILFYSVPFVELFPVSFAHPTLSCASSTYRLFDLSSPRHFAERENLEEMRRQASAGVPFLFLIYHIEYLQHDASSVVGGRSPSWRNMLDEKCCTLYRKVSTPKRGQTPVVRGTIAPLHTSESCVAEYDIARTWCSQVGLHKISATCSEKMHGGIFPFLLLTGQLSNIGCATFPHTHTCSPCCRCIVVV